MRFTSLLRKLRSRRIPPIAVPPPENIEATPKSERGSSGPWKWIVVLVLGTAIAGVPLYYPDLLNEAIEFADGWLPSDALLDTTPIAGGTATPAPGPATTPTPPAEVLPTPVAASGASPLAVDKPKEEAAPFTGAAGEERMEAAAEIAVGAMMNGNSGGNYVTLWTYPGIDGGHQIVHRYETNTLFEIVEPDRTIGDYPVDFGGQSWLRVQAEDGLVGWVESSELEASPRNAEQ